MSGLIYTRGDVTLGDDDETVCIPYGDDARAEAAAAAFGEAFPHPTQGPHVLDPDWAHFVLGVDDDTLHALPLLHRVERALQDECPAPEPPQALTERHYETDTGELELDRRTKTGALFTARTPRTSIVAGHLAAHEEVRAGLLRVRSDVDGVVILTSMDGEPLATSESGLLLAVADQHVDGAMYDLLCAGKLVGSFPASEPEHCAGTWCDDCETSWRVQADAPGGEDTMLRKVAATIILGRVEAPPHLRRRPCVYPLDETGAPRDELLPVTKVPGEDAWALDITNALTPWFELRAVPLGEACPPP